jgi:hypothetical protein
MEKCRVFFEVRSECYYLDELQLKMVKIIADLGINF